MVNSQILSLFTLIFLGYAAKRFKFAREDWIISLNDFVFYVAFPALVFTGLASSDIQLLARDHLILANFLSIAVFFAAIYWICSFFRICAKDKISLAIAAVFGNVSYLGVPAGKILFESEGESLAIAISAVYLFFVFTVGIFFLEYGRGERSGGNIFKISANLLKLPIFWAVVAGAVFSFLNCQLPQFLESGLKMMGATASPLALFSLGMFVRFSFLKEAAALSFVLSFLKVAVFPLFVFFVLRFFGIDPAGNNFSLSVILASMPLAATNFVLAEKYGLNKKIIAGGIILTTVISLFEIPLIIKFLNL